MGRELQQSHNSTGTALNDPTTQWALRSKRKQRLGTKQCSGKLAAPETSGRLSTSVQRFDFCDRFLTSVSYDWSMVSKVTVNLLKLAKITQTIPDFLASNASAQSSRSFWSGQLYELFAL